MIKIFHYGFRQSEGLFWLIMHNDTLHYVASFECSAPLKSIQDTKDMVSHPQYPAPQLPRFHLQTNGQLTIKNLKAYITP